MRNEIKGVLPQQLNRQRKDQVLMLRACAPFKLEKHVMPTYVVDTRRHPNPLAGCPDGGMRSAIVGDVCTRCGQTRADILETVEGKTCDVAAYRKFAMPLELGGVPVVASPAIPSAPLRALVAMEAAISANRYGRDPLAGIF